MDPPSEDNDTNYPGVRVLDPKNMQGLSSRIQGPVLHCPPVPESMTQKHMQVDQEHIEGLLKLCSSVAPDGSDNSQQQTEEIYTVIAAGPNCSLNQSEGNVSTETSKKSKKQEAANGWDQIQHLHDQIKSLTSAKSTHAGKREENATADTSTLQKESDTVGVETEESRKPNASVDKMQHIITSEDGKETKELQDQQAVQGRQTFLDKASPETDDRRTEPKMTRSKTNKGKKDEQTGIVFALEKMKADMERMKKKLKEKDDTIVKMKKDSLKKSEAILRKQKELKCMKEKIKGDKGLKQETETESGDMDFEPFSPMTPATAAAMDELKAVDNGLDELMCGECGKVFMKAASLSRHKAVHHVTKTRKKAKSNKVFYYCNACEKVFSTPVYLADHKKRVHPEVFIESDEEKSNDEAADTAVMEEVSLNEDSNVEEASPIKLKMWNCDKCKKIFSTSSNLHKHRRNIHGVEKESSKSRPVCDLCGKKFDRLSTMYRHLKKTHKVESGDEAEGVDNQNYDDSNKAFKCTKCRDRFSTLSNLYRHKRNVHSIDSPRQHPSLIGMDESEVEAKYAIFDANGKKRYKCDICNMVITSLTDLYRHLRKHGEKKFTCQTCGKKFVQKSSLNVHQKIHLGIKPHECSYCGKAFMEHKCMIYHVKNVHTGEKPYKCDQCDAAFVIQSKLDRHMKKHNDDRPYQCDTCGKCFSQIFYLNQHKRTHSGIRPFECDVCYRRFTQRTNLARHMRTHTGEKPYQCENCGKSFATLYSLENHKRTHTGERPFLCTECPLAFAERNSLKRHLRIHTGEKPYNCEVCGRAFSRKYDVKKHKRVHTGEKAYYCNTCGIGYNHKSELEKHAKTHVQTEDVTAGLYRQAYEYGFETVTASQGVPVVSNSIQNIVPVAAAAASIPMGPMSAVPITITTMEGPTVSSMSAAPISVSDMSGTQISISQIPQVSVPQAPAHHYVYTTHTVPQGDSQGTTWMMYHPQQE